MIQNPKSKETLIAAVMKSQGKKVAEAEGEEVEAGKETNTPEVDEEALRKEAEKIVFMQSKQSLQEKIYDGIVKLKEEVMETIMEDVPPESDWKIISGSELGKKLIEKISSAVEELKAA
jgi:hypothetical protein